MDSYNTPEVNWWYLRCFDPNWNQCGSTIDCSLYWNLDEHLNLDFSNPTQLGLDAHCLTINELNSTLLSTESYCQSQASAANKNFVNVSADWNGSLCGDYNHFWYGNLIIGRKIYRIEVPTQLPTSTCNCTE